MCYWVLISARIPLTRCSMFWGTIKPASQAFHSDQAPRTRGCRLFSGEVGEAKDAVDMAEAQEEEEGPEQWQMLLQAEAEVMVLVQLAGVRWGDAEDKLPRGIALLQLWGNQPLGMQVPTADCGAAGAVTHDSRKTGREQGQ
jgi:hypothetical protein